MSVRALHFSNPGHVQETLMKSLLLLSLFALSRSISPQLPGDYERVLLPVYSFGPGTHGSQWASVLKIRNGATVDVAFGHDVFVYACNLGAPCVGPVPSGLTIQFTGGSSASGLILYAPKADADDLQYDLRIHDVSRQLQTGGTELPVVPERNFSARARHLLDIPTSRDFRTSLRVYSLESEPTAVRVQIWGQRDYFSPDTKPVLLAEETLIAVRTESDGDLALPRTPSFAAIHDLFERNSAAREYDTVRITMAPTDATAPVWAFATVTNNQT
jgi:hypothetical protein